MADFFACASSWDGSHGIIYLWSILSVSCARATGRQTESCNYNFFFGIWAKLRFVGLEDFSYKNIIFNRKSYTKT